MAIDGRSTCPPPPPFFLVGTEKIGHEWIISKAQAISRVYTPQILNTGDPDHEIERCFTTAIYCVGQHRLTA